MKKATSAGSLAIDWQEDGLMLLDQRLLPGQKVYLRCRTAAEVATAIRDMAVRGAPAIGIAAAYGIALSAGRLSSAGPGARNSLERDIDLLANTRPTAVNLSWAIAEMKAAMATCAESDLAKVALDTAIMIHQQDIEQNQSMGEAGANLIGPGSVLLTHCNAGALATGGYGTALGVVRSAWGKGLIRELYATETRPWLQGARLTVWELAEDDIPVTLLVDSAVALLYQRKAVDWLIVGADRIAANGDVANKIGTLGAAVLAKHYGVRVMVVAPESTIDMSVPTGDDISLEERAPDEVRRLAGQQLTPSGQAVWNPVFDITPAKFIDVIVSNVGVVKLPDSSAMRTVFSEQSQQTK